MKIKIIGALVAAAALVTGCATEQAKPQCLVGHGDFVIKYYLKEGQPACAANLGITGTGEILSLVKYPKAGDTPSSMAIRYPRYVGDLQLGVQGLGGLEDFFGSIPEDLEDEHVDAWLSGFSRTYDMNSNPAVGVGEFDISDEPEADNYCRVTDFGFTSNAGAAEFPTSDPANFVEEDGEWVVADDAEYAAVQGPQKVTYAFKNTAFYVTTESPGLTFRSDVTFTEEITGVGAGTCTAEFTAIGMAPAYNVLGTPNVCGSDLDCDPCAFADDGSYIVGSGINPALDVVCDRDIYSALDPAYGYCFLRETEAGVAPELPSLLTADYIQTRADNCKLRELGRGDEVELDDKQQG